MVMLPESEACGVRVREPPLGLGLGIGMGMSPSGFGVLECEFELSEWDFEFPTGTGNSGRASVSIASAGKLRLAPEVGVACGPLLLRLMGVAGETSDSGIMIGSSPGGLGRGKSGSGRLLNSKTEKTLAIIIQRFSRLASRTHREVSSIPTRSSAEVRSAEVFYLKNFC